MCGVLIGGGVPTRSVTVDFREFDAESMLADTEYLGELISFVSRNPLSLLRSNYMNRGKLARVLTTREG